MTLPGRWVLGPGSWIVRVICTRAVRSAWFCLASENRVGRECGEGRISRHFVMQGGGFGAQELASCAGGGHTRYASTFDMTELNAQSIAL
jgi:hypothetical protein